MHRSAAFVKHEGVERLVLSKGLVEVGREVFSNTGVGEVEHLNRTRDLDHLHHGLGGLTITARSVAGFDNFDLWRKSQVVDDLRNVVLNVSVVAYVEDLELFCAHEAISHKLDMRAHHTGCQVQFSYVLKV